MRIALIMDFLKDKKNLPIVVGVAVAVLVLMGGLIAAELGLFSGGGSPTPVPPSLANRGGPTPGGPPMGAPTPGPMPASAPAPGPMPMTASHAPGGRVMPGVKVAAALPPVVVDPTKGPDPFSIPGGLKRQASNGGLNVLGMKGMKAPLRDILPAFNLFKLQPPAPPPAPPLPVGTSATGPAPLVRVVGIVNAADGIYAILEVNGQSQTVKPGDSLLDGSRVTAIQATSVTLRSGAGVSTSLPLTGGQGDQNGNGQDPNAGGQQFGMPGQQFGQPGQQFGQPGQP